MTHPRQMPQFGTWSGPQCPFVIEYGLNTFEAIAREVADGARLSENGGVEVGGLLLGTYAEERLRITGFEPVQCEYAFGPKFILSAKDTDALAAQLAARDVVGWYHSQTCRGLTLSAEDLRIHDRHFPGLRQVALLLRPDPGGGVHARFFFRPPGGGSQATLGASESFPAGADADALRDENSEVELSPEAVTDGVDAPNPGIEPRPRPAVNQSWAVWAVLGAMFALCVGTIFYLRAYVSPAARNRAHTLTVETAHRDGIVEVMWDKKAIGDARQGRLEIRDGSIRGQLSLDRSALVSGRLPYRQTTDVVNFRLTVQRTDGTVFEGASTFVASGIPTPLPAVAVQPKPQELPPPVAVASPEPGKLAPAPGMAPAAATTSIAADAVARPQPLRRMADVAVRTRPSEVPSQPEIPVPEPISAAQVARGTIPERPFALPGPPSAQQQPLSVPKAAASTPAQPFRLAGHWQLQPGGYSRSPAVPESVYITVLDAGDRIQGTLEARYRSRSKSERVHFSFQGTMGNSGARFPWAAADGRKGEIEFIRVPNSADRVEVVWHGPDSKQIFDEMLQRAN